MRLNVEVVHCGPEHDEASHPLGRGFLGLFGGREKKRRPLRSFFSCFGERRKRGDLQVGGSKSAQTQAASEQGGQLSIIQKTCSATLSNAYAFNM